MDLPHPSPRRPDERAALRADCARCAGLCCVLPAFAASADFAIDKPAGVACPNLSGDSRCTVHADLRERGFPGCTVFDCFGAGQRLVQQTFGGRDWRSSPELAAPMATAFGVLRQLQELLWLLTEALALPQAAVLHGELAQLRERTDELARGTADDLAALDVPAHRRRIGELLERASELTRADVPGRGRDRRGADLVGRDLRRTPLRGADLRGALLLGADLRGADLSTTDLLGADLRAADVRGAALAGALFLTQPQLTAARGDAGTTLPAWAERPTHWTSSRTPVAPPAPRRRPRRRR